MTRPNPDNVKRITCVGAGTIGGGWATYYLSRGFDVVATDPGPDAQAALEHFVDFAWPKVQELGTTPGAAKERLTFTSDLAEAVADADFIQESAPDYEDLKIGLFTQIGAAARPDTVIASSSSVFLPTRLASQCAHPERCVIGHPFTPSYIVPLVEVVGGEKTSPEVMDWTMSFYTGIGKKALRLKKEIESYVSNRLQHVVAEEAAKLVEAGICDYDDIDVAVSYGPGLRWAFAGPAMCTHLGGGKGGLEHNLEHFGWRYSDAAKQNLFDSVERMAKGKDIEELEEWRDKNLLAQLKHVKMTGNY